MRLNQFEIDTIRALARKHFGSGAKVYLFGSRTDHSKRGGDIDLLVQGDETALTLASKISFLAELKSIIGDQKIDLVFDNAVTRRKKDFYHSISRQKIEL